MIKKIPLRIHCLNTPKKDNDFFIDIHSPNRVHFFFHFQNKINLSNEIFDKQYYEYHKDLFEKGFILKKFDLFSYLIALATKTTIAQKRYLFKFI